MGLRGGGEAIVYVLLEHKSAPDPLVALQLLRYTTRLWDHHLRQGADPPLPPVVPLVFYHGRRRWKVATELSALLDPPEELKPFVPRFRWRRVLAPFSVHSPASKTPTCGGKWPSRACIPF